MGRIVGIQAERWRSGFTLLELLIALAVIGVVVGIAVTGGRRLVEGQEARAAVQSVRQSIWQGATLAASRGVSTTLVLNGTDLELHDDGGAERPLRTFALPEGATLRGVSGTVLRFTPPGKVDESSLAALPKPLILEVDGKIYQLRVSLIGEVKVEGSA